VDKMRKPKICFITAAEITVKAFVMNHLKALSTQYDISAVTRARFSISSFDSPRPLALSNTSISPVKYSNRNMFVIKKGQQDRLGFLERNRLFITISEVFLLEPLFRDDWRFLFKGSDGSVSEELPLRYPGVYV
jgi:hypothetical protein